MAVKSFKKNSAFKDTFYKIQNKSVETIRKICLPFFSMAVFNYIEAFSMERDDKSIECLLDRASL